MSVKEIRLGDVGTRFDFLIVDESGAPIDLDEEGYTVAKVTFSPISGEPFERDMEVSGSTGSYVVQAEDFEAGLYRLQGYVETPGGIWRSQIEALRVLSPNL